MSKLLNMFSTYPNAEYIHKNGVMRLSRWIKIQQNYAPNKRNRLYDYVCDENGYKHYQSEFNPVNGLYLDYFRFNGRNYALYQFYGIGSIADSIGHSMGYFERGEKHYLSGFDNENDYRPLLIELDEYGEHVRVYEEVNG